MRQLPQWSKIVLLMVMLCGIGTLVYFAMKRRRESEELYKAVKGAIRDDVGMVENEQADIDKKLLTTRCNGYDAREDAQTLMDAKGGFSWAGVKSDDDEAIFSVLRGKSSSQMKCLDEALNAQHGVSLSEYIEEVFGEYWDSENKQKATRIINSAQ